jgi:hypothetical protein
MIICQKQGSDFVATRTIVGSFKDAVTSQGSNVADIQSVYFGSGANCATVCSTSPCTICQQVGAKITSVTRTATGVYLLNGLDAQKYVCSGSATTTAGNGIPLFADKASGSSLNIYSRVTTVATDASYAAVTCVGIP